MNNAVRQHIAFPVAQRGAAVLLLVLILAVSTASYFLVKRLNGNTLNIERDKITTSVLAQAKAALIGYAAADSNRPGELICPDVDNDGKINISDLDGSDCRSLIGRLPWHTLRLPDLRDGYGERLWYALSDNFHANGATKLNSTTLGQLAITGTYPANAVVAIVFSPGPVLGNQLRDGSNVNNLLNYLEGDNSNLDNTYESNIPSHIFNDKLLPITYSNLFSAVTRRVASEISAQLASYMAHNSFPNSLALFMTDPLLVNQGWANISVTSYAQIPPNEAKIAFSGCAGVSYAIKWDAVNNQSQITKNGLIC